MDTRHVELIRLSDDRAVPDPRRALRGRPERVVVYGAGAIAAAAVHSLLGMGISDVVLVPDPGLDDAAADGARQTGLETAGEVVLGASDIVLATCDFGRADRLREVSRAALAADAVMIPAWLDGFTGHVGPVTVTGAAACLHCYELRRAANDPRHEVSEALRRHATATAEGRAALGFVEPMTGTLGELCALRIAALWDGGGEQETTGQVLDIDLVTCRASARHVLPVPHCPDCSGSRAVRESDRDTDRDTDEPDRLDRMLRTWDRLVDDRVGIVREVTPLPVEEDEPDFVHYLSTACDTERLTQLKNFADNGGVAVNHPGAVAKALGEAVERYCSAFFRYSDLVVSAYQDLPGRATHPDSFALYRADQLAAGDLPWRAFTVDAPVAWTTGVSLCTGEQVHVPAAMVYVPYHYLGDSRETPIGQPISTGLAAGTSFADAALSGLCEAIERDAFTITWQNRLSRPRVPVETLPGSCRDRVDRFTAAGLRVEIMDITTDLGVPTALTVAVGDRPTSPAVAVAAATHPRPEVAVIKSLEELAHTRKFARQVMDYTPALPVDVAAGHPEIQDQKHHLRFYCPQAARNFASFAWGAAEVRPFGELAEVAPADGRGRLAAVVDLVRAAGLDVIACDLTTPDVAELGLSVVRVVVPGLHPLFMGHRNRALGGRRLYEVPPLLGHVPIAADGPDNPYPHPFP
jgi:ribosomal protein S12 methylthiotransferase accessory factor